MGLFRSRICACVFRVFFGVRPNGKWVVVVSLRKRLIGLEGLDEVFREHSLLPGGL